MNKYVTMLKTEIKLSFRGMDIPFLERKIEALRRSTTLPNCAAPRRSWHNGRILPLAYGPPLGTASPSKV